MTGLLLVLFGLTAVAVGCRMQLGCLPSGPRLGAYTVAAIAVAVALTLGHAQLAPTLDARYPDSQEAHP